MAVNYPGLRTQQPSFVIQNSEIANGVTNYNTVELSLERFPNVTWTNPPSGWSALVDVPVASCFPTNYFRSGYEKMHYYVQQDTSSARIIVVGGSADKPTLKYAKMLMKGCNTDRYYTDTLNHGVLFYTVDLVSPNNAIREFVKGVIEDKTDDQIESALDTEEGVDAYEYKDF